MPTGTVTLTTGSYTSAPLAWTSSNSIAWIGDSLSAPPGGIALGAHWTDQVPMLNQQAIYMPNVSWNYAVAGQNTDYMLKTELPLLLAMSPLPKYVNILGGMNDVIGAVPASTIVANITAMVSALQAVGITPILCTIPPNDTYPIEVETVNAALTKLAASLRVTLVDFWTGLAQSNGAYQAQYYFDGTHPNVPGYSEMANAFIAQTASLYSGGTVWLPTNVQDLVNLAPDPFMENVPTSWVQTFYSNFATLPVVSGVAGASPVVGNWMQAVIAVDGTAGHYAIFGPGDTANAPAGDLMLFVARIKVSGLSALSPLTNQQGISIFAGQTSDLDPFVTPVFNLQADCPDCIVAVEYMQPTAPASGYNVGPQVYFTGGSTAGVVTLQLAQLGIVDLTSIGTHLDSTGSASIGIPPGTLPLGTDNLKVTYTPDAASSPSYNPAFGTASVVVELPVAIITGATLPSGTAGSAYSQTLTATGGAGVGYSWMVTAGSGSLTALGLSLSDSGVLTGAAPVAGNGSFTAEVTDLNGNKASQSFSVTVNPAHTFTIAGVTISVLPGAVTGNSSTITITPENGFKGIVNLSCAITPIAASDSAICSFSQPMIGVSGSSAQSTTLSVYTTAATALDRPMKPFGPVAGLVSLAMVLFVGIPARRRNWPASLGLLLFLVLATSAIGCAGGSRNPGTTPGSYMVTVTGTSGAITTTGAVPLIVQ
ncbi:Lysophospholipase L1 [Granulicella rosea]|uniref:Lysophospholipase L1 n=1 Tax=Granulicella rosea TaxID=474952 RepID=A0A239H5E8_9BACT|nr:GDSL-type esterase/lipase family protein [Granulicella rosea]SNS76649.1 Lysophospholipase L1 [Granulicella rosea]